MKIQNQDLFIIEDDEATAKVLYDFLTQKFHDELNIFIFENGQTALENVTKNTAIVVIDYDLKGQESDEIMLAIKKINPLTEVIILSSNEDIAVAIASLKKGASSIVMKGQSTSRILESKIYKIITYPADFLVKTFGINKMLSLFLLCIAYIGLVVFIGMQILK